MINYMFSMISNKMLVGEVLFLVVVYFVELVLGSVLFGVPLLVLVLGDLYVEVLLLVLLDDLKLLLGVWLLLELLFMGVLG